MNKEWGESLSAIVPFRLSPPMWGSIADDRRWTNIARTESGHCRRSVPNTNPIRVALTFHLKRSCVSQYADGVLFAWMRRADVGRIVSASVATNWTRLLAVAPRQVDNSLGINCVGADLAEGPFLLLGWQRYEGS